jgi:hypothetical protein
LREVYSIADFAEGTMHLVNLEFDSARQRELRRAYRVSRRLRRIAARALRRKQQIDPGAFIDYAPEVRRWIERALRLLRNENAAEYRRRIATALAR